MSSSLRRGALAATALVFSIASLAACGAGNDAQTLGIKPDNAATAVNNLKIQNGLVITQPTEGAEGPAVVSATIFNDGREGETLESITLPGPGVEAKLSPADGSGPIAVPAGGSVVLGGEGNASAVIAEGLKTTQDGDVLDVVFRFSETGDVTLRAFVVPAENYYKDFGPSSLPTAPERSPEESPAEQTPEESPAGGPTATPTGTPTGTPAGAAGGESDGAGTTPSDASSASHDAGH
ncbi:DUF461 domain-containing protein [Streptomyces sp. PR69]|uniref:DUF461 domain-containing protein n=1 Tax=Streptomyces sp. PR69 TaxID=2984950 RepID=UPI0022645619|nr:DUF461 domain-containing protein [Streptomyces sp. PR69]